MKHKATEIIWRVNYYFFTIYLLLFLDITVSFLNFLKNKLILLEFYFVIIVILDAPVIMKMKERHC